MKNILIIIIVISFGCNQINQKSGPNAYRQGDSIKTDTLNFAPPTTALPIIPLKFLPTSFALDSIISVDTTFNYFTTLYFPKSNHDDALNKSIQEFIQQQVNLEKPEEKTNDNTSFDMWITEIKISEHLIHCLFMEQSFTEGSAHFNHGYSTLNYDLIKKKKILFTDLFTLSSKKDKQTFCDVINESNDGNSDFLTPKDLNNNLDYEIIKDGLTLYFDDFEKAPSMTTIGIDLAKIQKFIDPTLGKDYSLIIPNTRN